MTSISTLPAAPRRREQQVSDFSELSRIIKDKGLLDREIAWYIRRMVRLSLAFAATGAAFVLLGHSWWQLAVAVVFSIVATQAGFLGHDAAHRQIFRSGKRNEWAGRIIATLFTGMSYGWWQHKHGRHHANPNKIGKDGDIAAGVVVFTPEDAIQRRGLARWFARHQGWFFFPLLTLVALDLHVASVRRLFSREPVPHRFLELGMLAVRLGGPVAAALLFLGPVLGSAFLAVHLLTFGLYLGGSFAPNHKGMPLVPKDVSIDFLRRQTLMSRNIRGGWLTDVGMGGLNYQIEHHLFPSMPSRNLALAQPIVKSYCAENNIRYTEAGLAESFGIITRYLNRVGLGERDPFTCPITAQLRSR